MELKNWDEYTEDEKGRLLIHWLYNFGNRLVNQDEIIEFYKLIDEDVDKVKDVAVSCFTMGVSNEYLINAMKGNFVGILLDSIPEKSELDETSKKMLEQKEKLLLALLVMSYSKEEKAQTLSLENKS